MLKYLTITAVACLAFGLACTDAAPPIGVAPSPAPTAAADPHDHDGDNAPRISLADAKKAFDDGSAVIVDVRDENSYRQEHIKGSINIPIASLAAEASKIPKGKKVIAYCS
ncbi:MAG: rhodanese-like domain-containing protein [Pyrinomonadaceae bacterium]